MKDSAFQSLRALRGGGIRLWVPAVLLGVLLLVGVGGRMVQGDDATADKLWPASQAPTAATPPAVAAAPAVMAASAGTVAPAGDAPAPSPAQSTTTAPAGNTATGPYSNWPPSDGSALGQKLKLDDSGLMWKMLGSVVVILVLAVPLVWLSRRFGPRLGTHAGKRLGLLETMYLGPRKTVHLVQVGSRRYLLGSSQDSVSLLAEVTSAFNETPGGQPKS